mmetsp:Transcript_82624/g.256954  ORF Transcript_82624/g.256954 Transcript_82624/m.256954 type:complete len:243 (+) Transcript_82624:300-1028(+)
MPFPKPEPKRPPDLGPGTLVPDAWVPESGLPKRPPPKLWPKMLPVPCPRAAPAAHWPKRPPGGANVCVVREGDEERDGADGVVHLADGIDSDARRGELPPLPPLPRPEPAVDPRGPPRWARGGRQGEAVAAPCTCSISVAIQVASLPMRLWMKSKSSFLTFFHMMSRSFVLTRSLATSRTAVMSMDCMSACRRSSCLMRRWSSSMRRLSVRTAPARKWRHGEAMRGAGRGRLNGRVHAALLT